jgi:alpha-1,3-glucosyltransferase
MAYVIMDTLEKVYLAGFPLLLLFVSAFPLMQGQPSVTHVAASMETCVAADSLNISCPEPQPGPTQSPPGVSGLEFLPLMATSIYCAIGLVWSFMRLGFIYLHEESTYQGQLSEIK